jgi:hypothetical protein
MYMIDLTNLVGGSISKVPQHNDNRNQTQCSRHVQRFRSHIVSTVPSPVRRVTVRSEN